MKNIDHRMGKRPSTAATFGSKTMAMLVIIMLSSMSTMSPVVVDAAFTSSTTPLNQVNSKFMGRGMKLQQPINQNRRRNVRSNHGNKSPRRDTMGMFLGTDGILGVGAPEVAVTLLVGYFILGPSDLYKLTKEIGKFIQSFRTLSSEASKSFESTMENQLELEELRKAQTELNQAFSFRRSINTDQQGEAFSELPPIAEGAEAAVATSAATATATATASGGTKKKRKRRRVKKKKVVAEPPSVAPNDLPPFTGDIPDLDMSKEFQNEMKAQLTPPPASTPTTTTTTTTTTNGVESADDAAARIRSERMDRLQNGQPSTPPDWYSASESDIASEVLSQQEQIPLQQPSPEESAAAKSRFANQLSGNWNEQILANEDALSPLGKVMERLAILEEEKNAADARLEEEFRLRSDNEERFYREKRRVLEDASAEIAAATYNFDTDTTSTDTKTNTEKTKDTKEKVALKETLSKDTKV